MRQGVSGVNMEAVGNIVSHVYFGGLDTLGVPRAQLWFLERQQNITGDDYTYKWRRVNRANGPSDRSHHSAIVVPDTTGGGDGGMFIWGGRGQNGAAIPDNKVYHLSGLGGPRWRPVGFSGIAPAPRFGHTAIYDGSQLNGPSSALTRRMFVFGGTSNDVTAPTDTFVWELRFVSGTFDTAAWSKPTVVGLGSPSPAPRFGQAMVWDNTNHTNSTVNKTGHVGFMFGGQTGASSYSDTLWALWLFNDGTVGWERRSISGTAPGARARLSMVLDGSQGPRLYLFGGENAAGQADDSVWVVKPWAASPIWERWASPGFLLSGQTAILESQETDARTAEVYSGSSGWQDALSSSTLLQNTYPPTFLIPGGSTSGGRVLSIGVDQAAYYLDVANSGSGNAWNKLTNGALGFSPESGVLYRPTKIMMAAGTDTTRQITGTTKTLDVSGLTNRWQLSDTTVKLVPRYYANLVILPDGKVMAVGGVKTTKTGDVPADLAVRRPQIWNPDGASGKGAWTDTTLDAQPLVRNYHSTAILLPDGRVLSAGGEGDTSTAKYKADLYCPPYLFNSAGNLIARPTPSRAPAGHMNWTRIFTVETSSAATIQSMCLIRPGATTHAFDENQRYVPLSFVRSTSPSRLFVTAPIDSNTAPPGDYLMFLVDSSGAPSVATWIKIDRHHGRDSADVTTPGTINYFAWNCSNETAHNFDAVIGWSAPGDDGTLSASGRCTQFDLRQSGSPITTDGGFNLATQITTPAPGDYGTNHQVTITGLGKGSNYYFRIKSLDDNQNLSSMSNEIHVYIPTNTLCDDGSGMFAGGGAGGGSSMHRVTGSASLKEASRSNLAASFVENSLFTGAQPDAKTTDILRLVSPTVLGDGSIQVRLRTVGARHMAVDRVRLITADHGSEGTSYALLDRVALGTRVGASRIVAGDSTEITTALNGTSGYPAVAGETLTVDLGSDPTGPTTLVIEAASGSASGSPDSSGIELQSPDSRGGWITVQHIYPRQNMDAIALDGISRSALRLKILSPQTLNFVGRLVAASETPTVQWATLTKAQGAGLADKTPGIASADTSSEIMAGPDTLTLAFAAPSLAEGKNRDYFLVVDATPLSTRGIVPSHAVASSSPLPTAFALRQNQPNPFTRATSIRFELPVGAMVRMEVFDAQGRRVKQLASHFFPAGYHSVIWDHVSDGGQRLGPGVYFYRIEAGTFRDRKKMVLLANERD